MKSKLLLITSFTAAVLSPQVLAAPFDFGGFSSVLGAVGGTAEALLKNESALFFILLIVLFVMFRSMILASLEKVPGMGSSAPARSIAATFGLLITIWFGYQYVTGPLGNLLSKFGGIAKIMGVAIAILLYSNIKKKTKSTASPFFLTGLIMIFLGFLTGDGFLSGIGIVLIVMSVFKLGQGWYDGKGRPSDRNATRHQKKRWYHRFKKGVNHSKNAIQKSAAYSKKAMTGMKQVYDWATQARSWEDFRNKIAKAEGEEFKLLDKAIKEGRVTPKMVSDHINHMAHYLQQLEKSDQTIENLLHRMDAQEKLADASVKAEEELQKKASEELNTNKVKDREDKVRRKDESQIEKEEEQIQHDIEKDEKHQREDIKALKKEQKKIHSMIEQLDELYDLVVHIFQTAKNGKTDVDAVQKFKEHWEKSSKEHEGLQHLLQMTTHVLNQHNVDTIESAQKIFHEIGHVNQVLKHQYKMIAAEEQDVNRRGANL